jgi:lipoprotein signal peptidase
MLVLLGAWPLHWRNGVRARDGDRGTSAELWRQGGIVADRDRHGRNFLAVALLVVLGDLVTKQFAVAHLGAGGEMLAALGDRVRLVALSNTQSAFGISFGSYTWNINVGLTLAAIVLIAPMCRELAAIDAHAPQMLGLIAGGAGGNLLSLLTPPHGVPDFIAIDHGGGQELVFNVADVAAYAGLLLMLRVGYLLARRLRGGDTGLCAPASSPPAPGPG